MAKRKDDFSFSFTPGKKQPPSDAENPPGESAENPVENLDPLASSDDAAADSTPTEITDPMSDTPAPEEDQPQTQTEPTGPTPKEHRQFRILILADLSGRTNRQIVELVNQRKIHVVDADTLDQILARLKPEIHLPIDDKTVLPLKFHALDDFRPDALLQQIPAFQALLQLRADLQDPKKFPIAAEKVRQLSGDSPASPAPTPATPSASTGESEFERMLNRPIAPKNSTPATADALIANLVTGYGVPSADPDQARLVKFIEDALSAGLRAVLHHPAYQALESAWRSIAFLTSRLNTDEDLKLNVLDISRDELAADLTMPASIEQSGLYRLLIEQTRVPGSIPFALVVGDYSFEPVTHDIALLAKLATLMSAASIPFLSGAAPAVAGFPTFDNIVDAGKWQPPAHSALWDKIRSHKNAAHLGLVAPRYLLRLPYGPKTDAIETYPFDEMPAQPIHDSYLWGNGAYAAALVIGEAFLESGWEFEPGNDVSDLPCHMAMVDGDKQMTPCAEGWLSDRIGDILHREGLIPLLSVRNAAAIKVAGIHSLAHPSKPLAAFWQHN